MALKQTLFLTDIGVIPIGMFAMLPWRAPEGQREDEPPRKVAMVTKNIDQKSAALHTAMINGQMFRQAIVNFRSVPDGPHMRLRLSQASIVEINISSEDSDGMREIITITYLQAIQEPL